MKKSLVGVDIGSGGCKVLIIDLEGKVRGQAYREWPTYYPHPGWSEQNPEDWIKAFQLVLKEAMAYGKIGSADIAAISVGSTTHSIVLLDEQDQPLRPSILWTDNRTIKQVESLKANHGELIFKETLHAPGVNWSLPYLIWVRENEPEIWKKTKRVLMPKDYIRLQLTGVWVTDPIDAVGTLMFNPLERRWSQKVCDAVEIPIQILPPLSPPTQTVGGLTRSAAERFGLLEETPVIVGTTDQASEALGAGAIKSGQGILKLATAGNVAIVTESPHPDPLRVYAYLHVVPNLWYTLTGVKSCAVCYRWLRDSFFGDLKHSAEEKGRSVYELMDAMAENVPLGSEGLIFHPNMYGSLTEPRAKGDFTGITFRHTLAHFARSVLEGVAFAMYEAFQREEALGVRVDNFRLIGGGSRSSLWRRILCNVFGKQMIVPAMDDSSFGTALLGGIATGVFKDVEDAVDRYVHVREEVTPDENSHRIYQELFACYEDMQESLIPNYIKLDETGLFAK